MHTLTKLKEIQNKEIETIEAENKMTSRRALVSLPDGVWKIIDNELKGQIGDGDSEVIRNIVIAYLTEKGYLLKRNKQQNDQLAAEIDIHDNMITSLAEILE